MAPPKKKKSIISCFLICKPNRLQISVTGMSQAHAAPELSACSGDLDTHRF